MIEDKEFLSLGIAYDEKQFSLVKNRGIYSDTNFPPTKPISGGFWGSAYFEN